MKYLIIILFFLFMTPCTKISPIINGNFIDDDISKIFPDAKIIRDTFKASADKSGKSIKKVIEYRMNFGEVQVACDDWSDEMNIHDVLSVIMWNIEFAKWLSDEAY